MGKADWCGRERDARPEMKEELLQSVKLQLSSQRANVEAGKGQTPHCNPWKKILLRMMKRQLLRPGSRSPLQSVSLYIQLTASMY